MGQLAGGFDSMFDNISGVLNEVIDGSQQIDEGAKQFASASQELSEGASQQAAALEQIAASLEEVGSMVRPERRERVAGDGRSQKTRRTTPIAATKR